MVETLEAARDEPQRDLALNVTQLVSSSLASHVTAQVRAP